MIPFYKVLFKSFPPFFPAKLWTSVRLSCGHFRQSWPPLCQVTKQKKRETPRPQLSLLSTIVDSIHGNCFRNSNHRGIFFGVCNLIKIEGTQKIAGWIREKNNQIRRRQQEIEILKEENEHMLWILEKRKELIAIEVRKKQFVENIQKQQEIERVEHLHINISRKRLSH
jgi:hypothetical protein